MLGIDKSGGAACLLHLRYGVQSNGGFTRRLGAVYLNNTPLGIAAAT
jgi:hypothetical protein